MSSTPNQLTVPLRWLVLATTLGWGGFLLEPAPAVGQDVVAELFRAIGNAVRPPREAAQEIRQFRVVDIADANIPEEFSNQFTPHFNQLLNTELHFIRKVCEPDEQQFVEIQRRGAIAVGYFSHYFAHHRRSGQRWTEPREAMAQSLLAAVDAVMPTAASEAYAKELEARRAELHHAALHGLAAAIDRELRMSPGQAEAVRASLDRQWDPRWDDPVRLLFYFRYIQLPPPGAAKRHLSSAQQDIWLAFQNRPDVKFSVQFDLGDRDMLGDVGLPRFPPPEPAKTAGTEAP